MILITGGLGFLGVALARYLLEQGKEVLLTKRRTSRLPVFLAGSLNEKVRVVDCDILDFPNLIAVLKKYRVQSVIHAAGVTDATASLYQGFKINLEGTINILEAARLMDIKRVSFTSSITVYFGVRSEIPYTETMAIPLDGKHYITNNKIAVEVLGNLYAGQYGLELITSRISMAYGPYSASTFTPLEIMVEGAAKEKEVVFDRVHPEGMMDYIYVDDCARAIGMLHLAKKLKYTIYNVASGKSHTYREVVAIIKRLIPDCHIELKGELAPKYPVSINIDRIQEEFGFKTEYDLENGIRKYIDWIVQGKS
jgi:UDP-glucose 4-epimerase